ncbi:nucleoside triphosphate pyrophosphohydrolase [Pseudoalteromonas piscicida]|uniref:Nucleoside triphosphate pyrophosphohydrolase n=1 Tax=Pseudoalteromonas piscicida TaxID=43662 RepID=A0A2A5JV85_PSEO7|nr:nucleoside triphosphate pyrophosphohydrolase [Pseudoalteromonas piscicida]PCK33266.1 nucleoside triphosphate pyrophosphohydrolase [Pseudoalteromonas piscicida]
MPNDSKSANNDAMERLLTIMSQLRDPNTGCDWDKKQTFATIVPHTLEEAHEVADAIERGDLAHLKEELGDLLFQVIFYAQLGKEQGLFDFEDIVQTLNEKLVRRHPHVFEEPQTLSEAELEQQWHAIKQQEKPAHHDIAFAADIPASLPALSKAYKIQKKAAKLGFDWPSYHGAWDKVKEEVDEVAEALQADPLSEHTAEEVGDLLFATVNVSRHIKRDPEQLLRQASEKFKRRFVQIEAVLHESSLSLEEADLATMDAAWETVKRRQQKEN